MCWLGCGEVSTFMHILWLCPDVKRFWKKVINDLSSVLKMQVPYCPATFLFGKQLPNVEQKQTQYLVTSVFLAVKWTILMN